MKFASTRPAGRLLPLALAVLLPFLVWSCGGPSIPSQTLEFLSPIYNVDREYRSMVGPTSTRSVSFPEAAAAELLWVTGYSAVMVEQDGVTRAPQEYMCHSNLDFDPVEHSKLFDLPIYHTGRLFTLSQGQQEIHFPPGFGLPYYSDEAFSLTTQALNLNPDGAMHRVRHKVKIEYVRDRDLQQPMKPLFMTSGWGLVLVDGQNGYFGVADPDVQQHGPGCLTGLPAGTDNYQDDFERKFSGHWVVQPGREVNSTLVTRILNIPYDTTVHYIAVHLHPFAESLELFDRTTNQSVFKSRTKGYEGKIGLKRVDYFSSAEGIPVYKDHEYEMVSTYNNTTDRSQDSMAVMLLYLLDKKFDRHKGRAAGRRVAHVAGPAAPGPERLLLHTSQGDLGIDLYPGIAPAHVEQVLRLARLGVYDTTAFHRIDPEFVVLGYPASRSGGPLTAEQQQAIRPLAAELSDLPHVRGTVSMSLDDNDDPNSASTSFFIVLGQASGLDGRYTVIGHVRDGLDTLDRMLEVPRKGPTPTQRVELRRAEVVSR